MNLIIEKTRKNDVFKILITSKRDAFRIYGNKSVSALFLFSSVPASLLASLGSAALVVPSLQGLLAGVVRVLGTPVLYGVSMLGAPFRCALFKLTHYPAPSSQCVGTPHGEMHFMMTRRTIVDADMRVISSRH
jgi:hypothetical protein